MIYLTLVPNEVMGYTVAKVTKLEKNKTQELGKYMKGEVRAQSILIESMKDHLIPFAADLMSTPKEIYDKLVKLYSVNTIGQKISLTNKIYKIRLKKDEDLASYLLKVSELKDQLQGHRDVVYDYELITCVHNALPLEWSSFMTSIYSRNDTPNFDEIWYLSMLEETILKENGGTKPNEKY